VVALPGYVPTTVTTMNDSSMRYDQQRYPLQETTQLLNDRLGLYLSDRQQQTMGLGLFFGLVLAIAGAVFSAGMAVRRDRR
jgi:hypothetical protein